MSNLQVPDSDGPFQLPPPPESQSPTVDVERQKPAPDTGGFGVTSVLRRSKREELMRKGSTVSRAVALLFSLLSFLVMASNRHGYGKNFDEYEEYRYVLAIAILSSLYTAWQCLSQMLQFSSGKKLMSQRNSLLVDFFGDQVVSYLLISSASSAVPMTNNMREGSDNSFTDSSAAAIAMSFLAFFALALSALISGYKLSTQSQI